MTEKTIVLATGNTGKVRELQELLADTGYEVRPQSDYATPDAIEDGLGFVENALNRRRWWAGRYAWRRFAP